MPKTFLSIMLLMVSLILPVPLAKANETTTVNADCVGHWEGQWTDEAGHLFTAQMQLQVDEEGRISGEIHWVFEQSLDPEEQTQLGLSAIEMVSGRYDPTSRVLVLEGVSEYDPHNVIGQDKYKLLLADNSNVLGGITWNHGNWLGIFSLTRGKAINPEHRE